MQISQLVICLFLTLPLAIFAQENDFTEEVKEYLDSNGTTAQYQYAYDELLKMLGKQYPKTVENTAGWDFLEGNKDKSVSEMKSLLVLLYQNHFEQEDIQAMTSFFQSTTGKQLLTDRSMMTESQKQELNSFYNTAVGQKIIEKQSILTAEISKISESWSRDLYETALSLLK